MRRYSAFVPAKVAELVDALDLGSSRLVLWGFDSPLSHSVPTFEFLKLYPLLETNEDTK